MKLIAEGRYLDRLNEYYLSGEQKGYRPLAQATDEMERRLLDLNVEGKALLIAVTHDINVASFLAGRGVVPSFTDETWPHYLDAADHQGHRLVRQCPHNSRAGEVGLQVCVGQQALEDRLRQCPHPDVKNTIRPSRRLEHGDGHRQQMLLRWPDDHLEPVAWLP